MRFEPVFLPEGRELGGRVSQTMLRHFNNCPRSGYFYAAYKGEASTVEMERGKAVHTIIERTIQSAVFAGEERVPPEVAKAIAEEVLAETHLPIEEQDYVREVSYRFGDEWTIDPQAVIACETLIVLELGGWQVRMKVDFAEARDGGATVYVADHKSGRGAPSFEDVARKRPDGSLAAKNFQLLLYALGLAFGVPVRIEKCEACAGTGMLGNGVHELDGLGNTHRACTACGGSDERSVAGYGYVEVPDPFPLAPRAQQFELEFVFPGVEDAEGKMLRRPVSVTKLELEEYRASFAGLLARLRRSEETGDWPAIVSDAACGECPAKALCPIPVELRDHRGTINTVAEAAEALEKMDREKAVHSALGKEIKVFAKAHGLREVRFGLNKARRFVESHKTEIKNRDSMFAEMERAVSYGEPFDRAKFVKTRTATEFKDVTRSEAELAEERLAEGSNEEAA